MSFLLDAVNKIEDEGCSRFYMPGHKGAADVLPVAPETLKYDITEVSGADSLYEAEEAIYKLEKQLAAYYGSKRTLISAGGSTLCIQTMLSLVRGRGKNIIMARNSHVSAVNAVGLLDFTPIWVYPDFNGELGTSLPVTAQQVERALAENSDAAAVYITSPNYFGAMADIGAIAKVCKSCGVPLLCDNAHGAHLKALGGHPITLGADMCCDSAHKTLPALTGSAYLHIANEEFIPHAKEKMAVFGSTSPSYLIMLSIDSALSYMLKNGDGAYKQAAQKTAEMQQLAWQKGFYRADYLKDGLHLYLCGYGCGLTGEAIADHLRRNKIEPEYVGENTVILLTSPFNSNEDFARLKTAVETIGFTDKQVEAVALPVRTRQAVSVRNAMFAEREIIAVENAEGKIAAAAKSSCPPGVPVVMPGEKITAEVIKSLKLYGFKKITVIK